MEHSAIPISFVTWLFGSIITLLTGCWAIFKYFESKLNRVYERLDENKDSYYKAFVSKEVYQAQSVSTREVNDLKFEQQLDLFNEKIESLKNEIRAFATAATAAATAAATNAATSAATAAARLTDRKNG